MSVFANIDQAAISANGPKLNPGHNYLLEIRQVTFENKFHGATFIAEFVVHESDDPLLPACSQPSWTANLKHAPTKGNILCFVGSAYGVDPADEKRLRATIKEDHVNGVVSPANPTKGLFIRAMTQQTTTAANKREFTVVKWAPGPAKGSKPSLLDATPVVVTPPSAPEVQLLPAPSMPGAFVPPSIPGAAPSFPSIPGASAPSLPGLSVPMPGAAAPPSIPGAAPSFPSIPTAPSLPVAPTFPPAGWTVHPQSPGWYYKGQEIKSEADLRAGR